ncbi:MAG: Fe-S cluster assembly protein HesB [Planctomycetes bacterium]|nr:Fe-S cluster assembly protein HesB [Planctomycetota bacterium]
MTPARPQIHTLSLTPPRPFRLATTLFAHGWIDLAPHLYLIEHRALLTTLVAGGEALDVRVDQRGARLRARALAPRPLTRPELGELRRGLARMLHLDLDLGGFWRRCAREPRLRWVARCGAGRLLRAPTLFEDLLKILFTTNCSWAATRKMVQRTVDLLGPRSPGGRAAFPDAATCAAQPPAFWREQVRAGYRSAHVTALAERFASSRHAEAHFCDPDLDTAELRRRLLALPGFGPYAAGQALRLLGRHQDLALDSWCRGKLARMQGRRRPPSDAAVERAYRGFAPWQGLALWMDLTADWHRTLARKGVPSW